MMKKTYLYSKLFGGAMALSLVVLLLNTSTRAVPSILSGHMYGEPTVSLGVNPHNNKTIGSALFKFKPYDLVVI